MTPTPHPPYEWDENKRQETLRSRGLDFALVSQINWDTATHRHSPPLTASDREGEPRYSSYFRIDDRVYNIVWTPRGPNTRIITLRKANRIEIARYEHEKD